MTENGAGCKGGGTGQWPSVSLERSFMAAIVEMLSAKLSEYDFANMRADILRWG